eukprot:767955-Hanusia_phi.AAC.11
MVKPSKGVIGAEGGGWWSKPGVEGTEVGGPWARTDEGRVGSALLRDAAYEVGSAILRRSRGWGWGGVSGGDVGVRSGRDGDGGEGMSSAAEESR